MQAATTSNSIEIGNFYGDYWQQSRRPLTSLAFVTPLLIVYELSVVWLGPQAMRNGADVWLRQLLDLLGFSEYFLLPALTLGLLAGWHHVTRQPWRVSPSVLYTKLAECVLLAIALVVVARVQANLQALVTRQAPPAVLHASLGYTMASACRRLVSFMGAGIYEELLFRLMMVPLLAMLLRCCGCTQPWAWASSVLLSSIIFAAAHHVGALGEQFQWYAFVFRVTAGLLFATLFVYRGFGIAVGTHAIYDVLVGLF